MACHMALSLKDVIFVNIRLRDIGIKVWDILLSSHISIGSHSALFRLLRFRLFCFALRCGVNFCFWWHKTTLGWFY